MQTRRMKIETPGEGRPLLGPATTTKNSISISPMFTTIRNMLENMRILPGVW